MSVYDRPEIIYNILGCFYRDHKEWFSISLTCRMFNYIMMELCQPKYNIRNFVSNVFKNKDIDAFKRLVNKEWMNNNEYNIEFTHKLIYNITDYPQYYALLFENDNLELFKYLLQNYRHKTLWILNKQMIELINTNNYKFIDYLLSEPKVSIRPNITTYFRYACKMGCYEVIEVMLKHDCKKTRVQKSAIIEKYKSFTKKNDNDMLSVLLRTSKFT
jgi:hypothetical protein